MSPRRAGRMLGTAAGLCALAAAAAGLVAGGTMRVIPEHDAVFTSTREVFCLAADADGSLWAGTAGGILRRAPDGTWRKFTRQDGLPSHEARRVEIRDGQVTFSLPQALARWSDTGWQVSPGRPTAAEPARWRGMPVAAGPSGLRVQAAGAWREIPLPPRSTGTHASALLARGETLLVAMFGEGLWTFDGREWSRAAPEPPEAAREITALAETRDSLWIGTRREGVWQHDGRGWIQHLQPDEPADHNVQSLALYRGSLLAGTLEDGLVVRSRRGWERPHPKALSSPAPRQMVEFGGALYLRHGSGKVDRLRGENWTRNVCDGLPRRQVSALAADGRRLYAAQWGGWSEFDGREWTHHLKLPELQGLPITALLADGPTLWIGTQGRGLAEADRHTGKIRWHDERRGLPDDWVTVLARAGERLYAGTFVGGLAARNNDGWRPFRALAGENVTDLAPDGAGGLWIATRTGVRHLSREGDLRRLDGSAPFVDAEAQALCPAGAGVWVGTRTGLFFVQHARPDEARASPALAGP